MTKTHPQATAFGWFIILAIAAAALGLAYWTVSELTHIIAAIQSGRGISGGTDAIIYLVAVAAGCTLLGFIPYFIASYGSHARPIYFANLAIILSPFLLQSIGLPLIAWLVLLIFAINHRKP